MAECISSVPTRTGSEHTASGAPPEPARAAAEKDQTTVASAALPPRLRDFLRVRQPSIFWSLVLHLIFCQVNSRQLTVDHGSCTLDASLMLHAVIFCFCRRACVWQGEETRCCLDRSLPLLALRCGSKGTAGVKSHE